MMQFSQLLQFSPLRLAIVMLGDRLCVAAIQRDRHEVFTIDAENPGAALRAELDARNLVARKVAIGLVRSAVTVKPIGLPSIAGETHEMVKFELERHLPIPADDAAFDFVPLPSEPEPDGTPSEGRRVLIAAADRRVIEVALRVCEEAKLQPVSITVAAHDLVSLVTTERQQRVAWLHRSRRRDRSPVASGPGPGVEPLLPGRRRRDARERDAAKPHRSPLARVRRGVGVGRRRRRCRDARSRRAGLRPAVDRGGAAESGRPRRSARRGELAVATAWRRGIRPLDLIPAAIKPRRFTRQEKLTGAALAATVVLALVALLLPGFREGRRLARLNAEIARIDPEVKTVERAARELERKRQLIATLEKAGTGALQPLPMLRELTEIIPGDAWITYLAFDSKGVELTGQAGAASTLIPLLENSPRLERVEFASPVTRGRDKEQFRIRASWEAPSAAAQAPPAPAAKAPGPPPVMAPPTAGPAAVVPPAVRGDDSAEALPPVPTGRRQRNQR
jgi:Tfp pilus assembly protein PilN